MSPMLGTIRQTLQDGFLEMPLIDPPSDVTVLHVTGGGTFGAYLMDTGPPPNAMVLAFDDGSEIDLIELAGSTYGSFSLVLPTKATRMWVKDVMDAYLDEMVGDVTAVENLDDWCYHGFYDYGLKVTEYIYGEAVSPNINDSQTVESILPDNEYVVSPSIYASNCPNLSAVEMLENVASWISQCPALSEHAGGYLYWQPGVEDWLSMYLPDNSLSADQVDTVLLYAGAAVQWDNAYQNGGYLDLSGNDPPTLSDPDVTDALNALTATGVDVYHD